MKRVSERLIAFRKLRGLSIRELSKLSGVSVVTIGRIERGGDTCLSTLNRLESVLETKLY